MNPVKEKVIELRTKQYELSMEILRIQRACQHDWLFSFKETHNNEFDFDSVVIKHYECDICGAKKHD